MDLFLEQFLGNLEMAKKCSILNPEVIDLDFDEKSQTLNAKSLDFINIENRALGYRIKYLLSKFSLKISNKSFLYEGAALFEKLNGTTAEEAQWVKARSESYKG
jgi:hypothetical protein